MERLKERLAQAELALGTLTEALELPFSKVVRDSAILRFVYTFESVWKSAQLYLAKHENVDAGSPAGVIRGCWKAGILDEQESEAALEMAKDRNQTVHTYIEAVAVGIYGRLGEHARLMGVWLGRMRGQ
jgi:nucleotidyltransferase substrate binding protein (TIGR01987 family)